MYVPLPSNYFSAACTMGLEIAFTQNKNAAALLNHLWVVSALFCKATNDVVLGFSPDMCHCYSCFLHSSGPSSLGQA